jgi:hypothetical protein
MHMKKYLLAVGSLFLFSVSYSQTQNWKVTGNTVTPGDYLGTSNNEPLILKSIGNEGLRIKPNGELRVKNFDDNTYTGLTFVNTNGVLSKLNFTGNSADILLGNGTFGSLSSLAGWALNGNVLFSNYNIGIGTNIAPEKLTVNGNIVANGSISGTSLNVVDIVTSGREFKVSTSLCMKGIDVNDPNSRNEICGMNGDLYLQSGNANYNTIINKGNGGKVGIGTIPSESFHVGVKARFDGDVYTNKIYTNRITSSDSIIHFGDSSLLYNLNYNRIYGSDNTYMKGIGIGRYTYAKGINSTAIGWRVRADGANAMVIGRTHPTTSSMLVNTIDNSLMIGFNSDSPTLFVSPATGGNGTSGAVGIGTTYIPDDYKLAVNGNIIAEEVFVKLRNGWPDYVFDANYRRMSILEKEKYISENKHLPGIASATEIEKTGIPTGEVMRGMTQNLEENSLEIIELYKMFEELKNENEALKKKVEELENK